MANPPTPSTAPADLEDLALPDIDDALPPLDFPTFILSQATTVQIYLGEMPTPDGDTLVDLPMARHTIDLIGMLRDKTHGNLTGEEERLLNQVLLDLRMKFVRVAGAQKKR